MHLRNQLMLALLVQGASSDIGDGVWPSGLEFTSCYDVESTQTLNKAELRKSTADARLISPQLKAVRQYLEPLRKMAP